MAMNRPKADEESALGLPGTCLVSVVIGILAGLSAVLFRSLIAFFHNLLFLGKFSFTYISVTHTPESPWGPFIIIVPVLGAAGVSFLVEKFAREAKGSGIPDVIESVFYKHGAMRVVVAPVKLVASALSLGSGAPLGREGPIVQITATIGSMAGRLMSLPTWQRISLMTAGAAGGVAATFNAPIGGMLFALEIILHEVSIYTILPLSISITAATFVGRIILGNHPPFEVAGSPGAFGQFVDLPMLIAHGGLGICAGLASVLFVKSLYAFEDLLERHIGFAYPLRHCACMLVVGLLIYAMWHWSGRYSIEGVGYATIQDILSGRVSQVLPLLVLFVAKIFATVLSLGSGGSGGIFSPALFLGATLGAFYANVIDIVIPGVASASPAFALAGMAAVVGGSTGAAVSAVVMVLEMTRDYGSVLPLVLTVALSNGMRKALMRENVYTLKLAKLGHFVPEALQGNFQYVKRARDVMEARISILSSSTIIRSFASMSVQGETTPYALVKENGSIIGYVRIDDALGALDKEEAERTLGDIARKDYVTVPEDATFFRVLTRMRSSGASIAVVVSGQGGLQSLHSVRGAITTMEIAEAMQDTVEIFSQ